MSLKVKRLIASIIAMIIYLIGAVGAFMDNYIVLGIISTALAIGAFLKKSIFLDFILIILIIIALSSLTLFTALPKIDGIAISALFKIVVTGCSFSLLIIYAYFLKSKGN